MNPSYFFMDLVSLFQEFSANFLDFSIVLAEDGFCCGACFTEFPVPSRFFRENDSLFRGLSACFHGSNLSFHGKDNFHVFK